MYYPGATADGLFNIAFVILLSDDLKWIARILGSGVSSFGPFEAQKLRSDFVNSIPIQRGFAWELDPNNPVGAPFHFEYFVEGTLLSERWTDPSWSTESKNLRTLRNLGKFYVEATSIALQQDRRSYL